MSDKNLSLVEFVIILLLVLLQTSPEPLNTTWYKISLVEGILVYSYSKNCILTEEKSVGNKSAIKINFYEPKGQFQNF